MFNTVSRLRWLWLALVVVLGAGVGLPLLQASTALASVSSPSINFCPSGLQTFGPVQHEAASGVNWVKQNAMPSGGGNMGIYFDPAGTSTNFVYPVFDAGGSRASSLTFPLSGGGTATFNDYGYSGTFSSDFIGCTGITNVTGSGSGTIYLNFVRNSISYRVPITITIGVPPQTLTFLGSVFAPGEVVGSLDSTTEWYNAQTSTWKKAYKVGEHPWGFVPGTNTWINACSTNNAPACLNTTIKYRVRFILPNSFGSASMTFKVIADNSGTFFLNGTQVGGELQGPPMGTVTANQSLLVPGTNELIILVKDWGGLSGFNYRADFVIEASEPIIVLPPASDTTSPIIVGSASPAPNANGWNNSDVTVTFTCADEAGGSGIASCGPTPVAVSTEGTTTVNGIATDGAGNSASTSVMVKIDKTAPTITGSASPAANANGWNNSNVVVSFACADGGSGVASCTAPVTVSAEGMTTIDGTVTDGAGNSASTSVTVKIDRTAPLVSVSGPAIIVQGQSTTATVTASDALSGLSVNPSGALALDTSTPGTHSATVTATDKAGNSASATLIYVVWTLNCEAPPIFKNGAGTGQFKAGSTIPVKCTITDGASIITSATGNAAIGPASAPLRYDPAEQRYIATVKTVRSATGSFAVIVTIDGVGSVQVATVTTR